MSDKDNKEKSPFRKDKKDKECDMDISKNDLAFAAMGVIVNKDSKK